MLGIHPEPQLAPGGLDNLRQHNWPGNVRELENVVESSLIQHRQGPLHFSRFQHQHMQYPGKLTLAVESHGQTLDEIVRSHIEQTLTSCSGKVNGSDGAAEALGIHPNTLRNKMRKLGIPFGRETKKKLEI